MILRSLASLTLALAATVACAQAPLVVSNAQPAATVLPIRDVETDRIEAFLLLEFPQGGGPTSSLDRLLGNARSPSGPGITIPLAPARRLSAQLSLESPTPLGVLCRGRGITATLGSLAEHCLLASLDASSHPTARLSLSQPAPRAELSLQGSQAQLAVHLGLSRYDVTPSLSLPGTRTSALHVDPSRLLASGDLEQRELGVRGTLKLGSEGWLSIGGTWAHARLVSAEELPGALPTQWQSRTLSLGAGVGNFGGELINRRIQLPGQTRSYNTLGVGVTWKTPWRAQLSVGAENLISNGKSPFNLPGTRGDSKDDEGRVPYVRYEQDL